MARRVDHQGLEKELARKLAPKFPGMTVEVGRNDRWDRPCVTFRWEGFRGLLPEERFHRLVQVLPEHLRKKRLAGFVWLELAPGESVDDFLRLPRSEDIAEREPDIYAVLVRRGFFDRQAKLLGPAPHETCPGDFTRSVEAVAAGTGALVRPRDVKLLFIRHGVYCDCQVLETGRATLAELYGEQPVAVDAQPSAKRRRQEAGVNVEKPKRQNVKTEPRQ